ncbi:hypothetical protein PR048_005868 [Dryococelus australis]|uniref:DDE Tnp4 domain-containing protein n=1 Tax=Dryococelus australis TaxID=614101 RepID=A0ABQ9I9F3_9NEOP|nr:hypothetical protein PR048_005868 [Dryococelus australis]
MSTVDELVAYATIARVLQKIRKRKRNMWTKQWFLRRNHYTHVNLLTELRCYPKDWTNYLRMDEPTYLELLCMVTPFAKNTRYLYEKSHNTKLNINDLKFSCHIAPQTLVKIIPDTCEEIIKALRNYCKCPTTEEEWENVAREFEHRWNFPTCIGAIDGKHVAIMPPPGSGSYFYINSHYELLYFSFETNRRVSDGGVFEASDLLKKLGDGSLNLPKEGTVVGKNMRRKVATPARKIFNYRLSRACRMIESVFGIIVERFGVLQKSISLIDLTKVHHIVMACCALQNFLRSKVPHQCTPLECLDEEFESGNATPGPRCNESTSLSKTACHPTNSAKLVRELFVEYFNNEGQVPWQQRYIE